MEFVWGISAALVLVGALAFVWRAFVFWRWSRDLTQQTLCHMMLNHRGAPEGVAEIIYHFIVDEKRWDRVYAAKRLAHALTLVEAGGAAPTANETARKIARAVCDRLWAEDRVARRKDGMAFFEMQFGTNQMNADHDQQELARLFIECVGTPLGDLQIRRWIALKDWSNQTLPVRREKSAISTDA